MSGRRCLITGATGFVGANLARRLLDRGDELHLLVRPGRDRWRIVELEPDVQLHMVDLRDAVAVHDAVTNIAPREVFHLAAYGAYPAQDRLADAVQTNVVATTNIASACLAAGVEAMVNAGSSSEYGLKDHAPAEAEGIDPNSHYAATKASGTLICRHLALNDGLPAVTLRLYSVYGPFEEPSRFIPTLLVYALAGSLPSLASPDIARDFIHVDDVCTAFMTTATRVAEVRGAIFNVGTGHQVTLRAAVNLARQLLGVEVEPGWGTMPDRGWDTTVWVADPRAIHADLGWAPRIDFETGLRLVVEWLRNNPDMRARYRAAIGLPA